MTSPVAHEDIDAACRLIARRYNGRRGVWAYEAFDYINGAFFEGELPTPLIIWTITPHGGCLAMTGVRDGEEPVIVLHPSVLGGVERDDPWKIDPAILGVAYAFDTLLHECIHVNAECRLGGWRDAGGESSHNNPLWIAEVNRLAPQLGLDVTAARSKPTRVPIAGAFTETGKPRTKVVRASAGTVPFAAVAAFPHGVRVHLGLTDFYRRQALPFPHALERRPPIVAEGNHGVPPNLEEHDERDNSTMARGG